MEFVVRSVDIVNISSNEESMEAFSKQQFADYQLLFDEEAQSGAESKCESIELSDLTNLIGVEAEGFGVDWKMSNVAIDYVSDIMHYVVASDSTSDSAVIRVDEPLVFVNSCVLWDLEANVRSLVLIDYEKSSSLFTLLQLKLANEVTQ